jgi:CHASE3 domain sensor protein
MSKLTSPAIWATAIATLALIVILAAAERTRTDVRRSIDAVSHTLDVQRAFNLVLKGVLDAETGQRGFLLTGSPAYLAPHRDAQASMPSHLESLRQVTTDDAHHHARVEALQTLVVEKMSELQATIDLAERGDPRAALALVKSDQGRQLMERSRRLLDTAFVEEQRRLRERQADLADALATRALLTNGMAVVFVAAVLVAALLHRTLQRLRPLVTVCAWSKTVQDGDEWVSFEQYLERRFGVRVTHGLSPEEVARLLEPRQP